MVNRLSEFTPVAAFSCLAEAHMAKHLLDAAGIASFIEGAQAGAAVINGLAGLGDQIRLQVLKEDAGRAALILADIQSRFELPDDWEHQAESGAECELCGRSLPEDGSACLCGEANPEGIRAVAPRSENLQPQTSRQAREGITASAPAPPRAETPSARRGCLGALLLFWW